MARCNCSGSACQCLILPGQGIEISGSGNTNDPYVVTSTSTIAGSLVVQDTATVDLTAVGAGTPADPFILTATATLAVEDLTDVVGAPPDVGDTLSWDGTAWVMAPPPVVPPGVVNVGAGLLGTGAVDNPIRAAVSGVWGTPPLDAYGTDSTVGRPVYVDANGQLRSEPIDSSTIQVEWDSIIDRPGTFPTTWDQVAGKPTSFPTTWTLVTGRPRQFHTTLARVTVPGNSAVQIPVTIPAGVFSGGSLSCQVTMANQSANSGFLLAAATISSTTAANVVVRNLSSSSHFGAIYFAAYQNGSYA